MSVRATPRAGRDAIAGVVQGDDGRSWLSVKLAAAPSDGEANAALVALLAKRLKLPRRDVVLASGAASRLKRLKISGDPVGLAAALTFIIEPDDDRGTA